LPPPESAPPAQASAGSGVLATPWAPRSLRRLAGVLGVAYLAAIWLDAAGVSAIDRRLPLPVRFYVQVAELFPRAARNAIEWRAAGRTCDGQHYDEIDVRPLFPIRRDDKESRFYRAMFFYYRDKRVLPALDEYITRAYGRLHPEAPLASVALLSLRIPIPSPATPEPPYARLPIADYPASVERVFWYETPPAVRARRCGEAR